MTSSNRQPYLTATALTQGLLDAMQENLLCELRMVCEIETPGLEVVYSNVSGNLIEVSAPGHPFRTGKPVTITGSSDPVLDGTQFVTAFTSSTFTFDAGSAPTPTDGLLTYSETIYASDRDTYVGAIFYKALATFPTITRTVGDWLTGEVEFSGLELVLTNVDGRYNKYLPGGDFFGGWMGKTVVVKIGLRDVAASYARVFQGSVTDVGGFKRNNESIKILARDRFDTLKTKFPATVFTKGAYPDLEDDKVGLGVPVVYGDWTTRLRTVKTEADPAVETASIPATVVNGKAVGVLTGADNVQLVISADANTAFDPANVYLFRSDKFYIFDLGDVVNVVDNQTFELKQGTGGGTTMIETDPFQYSAGDAVFVRVQGKDLPGLGDNDNFVAQAVDLLKTYGGVTTGDFHANWAYFQAKASPAESAVANFKSRIWEQEATPVIEYVLSLLEQVRLEAFIDRDLKLKLNSLHFDEFVASPAFAVRNWDIGMGTFAPEADDRNNWNRAISEYGYDPSKQQLAFGTPFFRNQAAIYQLGKEIGKKVEMPNVYREADAVLILQEMLKLASAYAEFIPMQLTPRAFLKDIGDFVSVRVKIGSVIFDDVPAMLRDISYDPKGPIPVKVWSFQMVPFPGYSPGLEGIVGGATATITQE